MPGHRGGRRLERLLPNSAEVLTLCREARFVDLAPAELFATVLEVWINRPKTRALEEPSNTPMLASGDP